MVLKKSCKITSSNFMRHYKVSNAALFYMVILGLVSLRCWVGCKSFSVFQPKLAIIMLELLELF